MSEARPGRYRKRPVVIDAIRYDGTNGSAIRRWAGPTAMLSMDGPDGDASSVLSIETLEGRMIVRQGDWVLRGVTGEYYPCKPDIFSATYEPVGEVP